MYSNDGDYPGLKDGEVSTGTTIMAIPTKDGVIMGADCRVSSGIYVVNRTSDKLSQLSEHIFCGRSGSAADLQALTEYVRFYLQQLSVETGREPTVKTAAHIMRRICYDNKERLLAGVIVSGWDSVDGYSVYQIPIGATCLKVPFAISGSGSTYIWGLVDSQFRPDMTVDEGRALVKKSIAHAMARDGSSGGSIRTVLITPTSNDRDYTPGNQLPFGPTGF
ncbi:hypothetical protein ACA910_010723 [Epithemia clementina (nom. ined.)]